MDAITPRERRFLPALAEAIGTWFPELGPPDRRRSLAVSDAAAAISKENVPTLPLVIVAFTGSEQLPLMKRRWEELDLADNFIVEFWLEPLRLKKANSVESPFWSFYPYEGIRETLLKNIARWETPNGEHIAYRKLDVRADSLTVTMRFHFTATFRWCANIDETGVPFKIFFGLCAPASCIPEPECPEVDECDPCK